MKKSLCCSLLFSSLFVCLGADDYTAPTGVKATPLTTNQTPAGAVAGQFLIWAGSEPTWTADVPTTSLVGIIPKGNLGTNQPGTAGQVLTSQGSAGSAYWATATVRSTNITGIIPAANLGTNQPGEVGQFFMSAGTNNAPYWQTVLTLTPIQVTNAINAIGTNTPGEIGQFLTSAGTNNGPYWQTVLTLTPIQVTNSINAIGTNTPGAVGQVLTSQGTNGAAYWSSLPTVGGLTTNISVVFGDTTTNLLCFTNGVLLNITAP